MHAKETGLGARLPLPRLKRAFSQCHSHSLSPTMPQPSLACHSTQKACSCLHHLQQLGSSIKTVKDKRGKESKDERERDEEVCAGKRQSGSAAMCRHACTHA